MLLLVLGAVSGAHAESSVAFLFSDLSDSFAAQIRLCLMQGLQDSSCSAVIMDAHGIHQTQVAQVQEAVSSGADLICVQSCVYASLNAASDLLRSPEEAGIPVIFFGRSIAPSEESLLDFLAVHPNCLYVQHDPADIGRTQGTAIGRLLCSAFAQYDLNGDGQISYIAFQGDPYDTDAKNRTVFALESANALLAQSGYPPLFWFDGSGMLAFADPQCMWSADFARNTLLELLGAYGPDSGKMPELIFCGNDDMANGSINALFHVGWNTDLPDSPSIPVYGVDGTLLAEELIQKGRMTGSVMRSPDHMARGILAGISFLLEGTPISSEIGRVEGPCLYPAYDFLGTP